MPKPIELKTKKDATTVDKFLKTIKDEQQLKDSKELMQILKTITKSTPTMWGKTIIGFGSYQYKRSNGDFADWFVIGFSPRKQNMTIYIMPGYQDYGNMLDTLGPHKLGKCCLYIKSLETIHKPTLKKLLKKGYEDMKKKKA